MYTEVYSTLSGFSKNLDLGGVFLAMLDPVKINLVRHDIDFTNDRHVDLDLEIGICRVVGGHGDDLGSVPRTALRCGT